MGGQSFDRIARELGAGMTRMAEAPGMLGTALGGGIWSDNNANTLDVSGTVSGNSPDQCAGGTITC